MHVCGVDERAYERMVGLLTRRGFVCCEDNYGSQVFLAPGYDGRVRLRVVEAERGMAVEATVGNDRALSVEGLAFLIDYVFYSLR